MEAVINNLNKKIGDVLLAKFGIPKDFVSIKVECDEPENLCERISIYDYFYIEIDFLNYYKLENHEFTELFNKVEALCKKIYTYLGRDVSMQTDLLLSHMQELFNNEDV